MFRHIASILLILNWFQLSAQERPSQPVFKHTFEKDEEGWMRTFGSNFTAQQNGNGYMLTNRIEDRNVVAKVIEEIEPGDDFVLSASIWHTEGETNQPFGLLWVDGTYEYNFLITDNGYFYMGVKTISTGDWSSAGWEEDSHIQKENSTNHIYIKKEGTKVTFYINGFMATYANATASQHYTPTQLVGISIAGKQEIIVEKISLSKEISVPHPDYMQVEMKGPKSVDAICFGGDVLVAASQNDRKIYEWDAKTLETKQLRDNISVEAYLVSADGKVEVIAESMGSSASVYDRQLKKKIAQTPAHKDYITALAISKDNTLLATGAKDNAIKLISLPTGKEIKTFKAFKQYIVDLTFTADNKYLAACSFENVIRVWDVASGKIAYELTEHTADVLSLYASADSKYLVSGSIDKKVIIWDLATGKSIKSISYNDRLHSAVITPDGKKIIASTEDAKIVISDVATGKHLKIINDGTTYGMVALSNDGKSFAYESEKQVLVVADVSSGNKIKSFGYKNQIVRKPKVTPDLFAHSADIMDIEVIEDGKTFVSVSKDKTVRVWDAATGENVKTFRGQSGEGFNGMLYRVAVAPDMRQVLVGGFLAKDGSKGVGDIRSFNLENGQINGVIKRHDQVIVDLVFSRDGSRFASADFKMLRIWESQGLSKDISGADVAKNEVRVRALKFEDEISSITLSPDGKKLAMSSSTNKDLYIADISSFDDKGNPASFKWYPKHEKNIYAVKFSPDGNILSAGPDNAVLWNANGEVLKEFKDIRVPLNGTISFSTDGKLAVVASQVLDLTTGLLIASSPIKRGNAIASAFVGKDVVATAHENVIVLWNARTGKEIRQLAPQTENIKQVAFVGDGLTLALSPAVGMSVFGNEFRPDQISSVFDFRNLRFEKYTDKKNAKNNLTDTQGSVKISYTEQNGETNLSVLNFGSIKLNADASRGMSRAYTLTKDGGALVGFMNTLSLFDKSGKEIKRYEGHNGLILSLAISADGKYFASFAEDNTVRLWNFDDAGTSENGIAFVRPRATLVVSTTADWICFTPDNFYASSRSGGKYVNFIFNNGRSNAVQRYTFDQFDLKFNRPDLVLESIGDADQKYQQAYRKAYEKRLAKYGFSEVDPYSFDVPELKLATASKTTALTEELIEFSGSSKYPITSIHISVNGVPVYGSAGLAIRDSVLTTIKRKLPVKLTSGKNVIHVSVMDEMGNESLKEIVTITSTATAVKGDLYLVAIGVSNYSDASYNLTYAAKDAQDLAKLYETKKANFNAVKIIPVTDQQATRENILKLKETLQQSKENDEVIIFFAGHGVLDDQLDYYFATHDLDFNDPSTNGLRYEELENLMDGIGARKKLILIDACHSGEIDKEETALIASTVKTANVKARGFKNTESKNTGLENSFELMQHLFADIRKGTGAVVIASASGVEFAYESPEWKNGVFTFSVLEGLKTMSKTDKNKNNNIEVSELKDYVSGRVVELTNGKQHPTSRKENLDFDFKVW